MYTYDFSSSDTTISDDDSFVESLLFDMLPATWSVQSSATGFHGSAADDRRTDAVETVCETYATECDVVALVWDFSAQERYVYTILSVYFLHAINDRLSTATSLFDVIQTVEIRSADASHVDDGSCESERRWCANHTDVIINAAMIESPGEFAYTLTHEIGHIVDLGVLEWTDDSYNDIFTEFGDYVFRVDDPSLEYYEFSWIDEHTRKKWAKRQDFCSLYSMTQVFEDFAECLLMYQDHNYYFKFLAKHNDVLRQKFMYFADLFDGKYIFANSPRMKDALRDPDARVWDLTKVN